MGIQSCNAGLSLVATAFLAMMAVASATDKVLVDYKAGNSKTSIAPGKGVLDFWTVPGPPAPITFKDTAVTETSQGVTFTSNPHKQTVPPGAAGFLDHIKFLAITKPFVPEKGKKFVFTVDIKGTSYQPNKRPYKKSIKNRKDDIRLGSSAATLVDFETFLVADFYITNHSIWASYDRLPFGRTATNNYASFFYAKKVATRSVGTWNKLTFIFDEKKQSLQWLVDGKVGLTVKNLGFPPPKSSNTIPLADLGGKGEKVVPKSFVAGVGSFTLLDFADPNNPGNKGTGLLQLAPDGSYQIPTKFVTDSSDVKYRLFGQGTKFVVRKFKVYQKY